MDDLKEFCETDRQRQLIAAYTRLNSLRKAAHELGITERNANHLLSRIKANAARRGYSPKHDYVHPVPETHQLRGASILYNKDGKPIQSWVKSELIRNSPEEILRAALEALRDDIPKAKPVPAPRATLAHLHNLYPITDYHLGMLAWGEECGEDWDTAIAEETIIKWFAAAIEAAPAAESCTFAQMGDFLHWDGLEALTPASKHVLDADTRFQKVVRTAIRVMRRIVAMLLAKHKRVHVVVCDANHDPASGVWLREMLSAFYEADKRVSVDNSPDTYYAHRHGKTLLMFHHGHKRAVKDLDSVLVGKFREQYGATQYHYAHTGHLHHDRLVESNLMHIEQHETLAPKDAYASRAGYLSKRSAKCITYSSLYGEVSRITIRPEMLR